MGGVPRLYKPLHAAQPRPEGAGAGDAERSCAAERGSRRRNAHWTRRRASPSPPLNSHSSSFASQVLLLAAEMRLHFSTSWIFRGWITCFLLSFYAQVKPGSPSKQDVWGSQTDQTFHHTSEGSPVAVSQPLDNPPWITENLHRGPPKQVQVRGFTQGTGRRRVPPGGGGGVRPPPLF